MTMSVSATGSNTLREYQKQTAAGASAAFPEATQQALPAPAEGKQVKSPQGFHKLSDKEAEALGMDRASVLAMAKQMLAIQEYYDVMSEQRQGRRQREEEFYGQMQAWLGGPQTAMAIPNDPLGTEPVRTSSGGIHPQSERIKDYIRAHQDEWNSLSAPIPSFEEWQRTLI